MGNLTTYFRVEQIIWECAVYAGMIGNAEARRRLFDKIYWLETKILGNRATPTMQKDNTNPLSNQETGTISSSEQDSKPDFLSNTVRFLHDILKKAQDREDEDIQRRIKFTIFLLHTAVKYGYFLRPWTEEEKNKVPTEYDGDVALKIIRDLEKHFYAISKEDIAKDIPQDIEDYIPAIKEIEHLEKYSPPDDHIIYIFKQAAEEYTQRWGNSPMVEIDTQGVKIYGERFTPLQGLTMAMVIASAVNMNVEYTQQTGFSFKPLSDDIGWTLKWLFRRHSIIGAIANLIKEYPEAFHYLTFTSPQTRGLGYTAILKTNGQILNKTYNNIIDAINHIRQTFLRGIYSAVKKIKDMSNPTYAGALVSKGFRDVFKEGGYKEIITNIEINIKAWALTYNHLLLNTKQGTYLLIPADMPYQIEQPYFLWHRHMVETPIKTFEMKAIVKPYLTQALLDPRMISYFVAYKLLVGDKSEEITDTILENITPKDNITIPQNIQENLSYLIDFSALQTEEVKAYA